MASPGRCPRGHDLAENAVYCTVCWIRVEPEDPAIVEARARRRRRIWIPLFAASSVLVGVAVGGTLAAQSTASVVAESEASSAQANTTASPDGEPTSDGTSEAAPVTATNVPLAATVVEPVVDQEECTARLLDQDVACAVDAEALAFTVCVPEATALMRARSRAADSDEWLTAASDVVLGGAGACAPGSVSAQVSIAAAAAGADGSTWRMVGRDTADQKIWKSRLVVTAGS